MTNVVKALCSQRVLPPKLDSEINDLFPVLGSNQGNNLTLKGWPLTVSFIYAFVLFY